ncbi:MAG: zinc ABC transporter solute-binding protein [Bacteroidales bacterium]|nr:zinc ABC transporter solute-binding protein [Bacteroidales bacterium]
MIGAGTAMCCFLTTGCVKETVADDCRRVTVTIAPLEYFVRNIGGDSVEVSTLMGSGSDPEVFQPGMGVMRDLSRSGNLLVTGVLPFESRLVADVCDHGTELRVGVAGEGIDYMYGTHSHGVGECAEEDEEVDGAGEPDPHIWSSARNAKIMADNTLEFLKGAFPELSGYLEERHAAMCMRLDSMDRVYGERLKGVEGFVIWHPSLSYFARDYGMEQVALNLENKETSSIRLKEAAEHALEHHAVAFFIPEGFSRNRVATLAETIGVAPTEINFMDSDIERQLNAVVDALTSHHE